MHPRYVLLSLLVLTFISGHVIAADVEPYHPIDVVITSFDGIKLRGSYFAAPSRGPAAVLFHQCGDDRHSLGDLARDLRVGGVTVLTFDARGTGQSDRGLITPKHLADDGDAAYSWLKAQASVDPRRLLAGGVSCGVAQATNLAVRHRDVHALILVSGGPSPASLSYLAMPGAPAVMGLTAERDQAGAPLIPAIRASTHRKSLLKVLGGAAHGDALLTPPVRAAITAWVQSVS